MYRLPRTLTALCLVMGLGAQAWAMDPVAGEVTVDELLEQIKAQAARLDKLEEKPKPNPITHKWSGRVHFDYWGFPDEDALFNYLETSDVNQQPGDFIGFRRLRFGVGGSIYDTMNYKIEMEFANPNDLEYRDVYIGWNDLPFLRTLLIGNQKRPYGLDHLNSSRYNIFIERLWWTLKYQYLYLWSFSNGTELRQGLGEWFEHYNRERSHQALDDLTPDEVYYCLPHSFKQAA